MRILEKLINFAAVMTEERSFAFKITVIGINFLTFLISYAKEIVFPNSHINADGFIGCGTGHYVQR